MFKNCVFKADVDTIKWAKAATRRAVKTMAQTAVATIGTAAVLGDVNVPMVISASVLPGCRNWIRLPERRWSVYLPAGGASAGAVARSQRL